MAEEELGELVAGVARLAGVGMTLCGGDGDELRSVLGVSATQKHVYLTDCIAAALIIGPC